VFKDIQFTSNTLSGDVITHSYKYSCITDNEEHKDVVNKKVHRVAIEFDSCDAVKKLKKGKSARRSPWAEGFHQSLSDWQF
jgi:hypothetical protein